MLQVPHRYYIQLEPSWRYMSLGLVKFFTANYWFEFLFFVEEDFMDDGFMEELLIASHDSKWIIKTVKLSKSMGDDKINELVNSSVNHDDRIILLHASVTFSKRIFETTEVTLSNLHISWFLTEKAYTRNRTILRHYPEGALVMLMNTANNINDILQDSVALLTSSYRDMSLEDQILYMKTSYSCDKQSELNTYLGSKLYRYVLPQSHQFL